jgi:hypothetical protein
MVEAIIGVGDGMMILAIPHIRNVRGINSALDSIASTTSIIED